MGRPRVLRPQLRRDSLGSDYHPTRRDLDLPVPVAIVVTLAIYLVVAVAYVGVAWLIYTRWGRRTLLLFWLTCSIAYGYLWFGHVCSQPLTCDVGGFPYWKHLIPRYTLIALVSLGVSTAFIARRPLNEPHEPLQTSDLLLYSAASVLTFIAVSSALPLVWRSVAG